MSEVNPKPQFPVFDVRNFIKDALEEAGGRVIEPESFSENNGVEFVYYARSGDLDKRQNGAEWGINFDRTTVCCMEWRNIPYLVIQGPYTPICFNLRRAFRIGENDTIAFGMDKPFIHMDPKVFPSEKDQQNLLMIAGNGNPVSGQ